MKVLINKFYKTKNNNIIVIVRDLGCFATKLVSKPTVAKVTEEVVIEIVKDFYDIEGDNIDIKFVDDPDAIEDVSIAYYETCYGWEA